MNKRLSLLGAFGCLALFGLFRELEASPAPTLARISAMRAGTPPAQPGSFPGHWFAGMNCATEPEFQVHEYNPNLYIIRQSKCDTFEAPFLYLIFGEEQALLMDTGAANSDGVYQTVYRTVQQWAQRNGVPIPPTIVAHTHIHGDHVAGDAKFQGQPWVDQVVSLNTELIKQFWGFQNHPYDIPTIDLGNRIIDVIATPGHGPGSVTLYDRETQLLLTGDIVYPGHLFVFGPFAWIKFKDSLRRLVDFANTHPVQWVVGCHIEMGAAPFDSYAWGTNAHPNEHPLQLHPSKLLEIYQAAQSFGNDPQCTKFAEFVIHPVYKCGITWNG